MKRKRSVLPLALAILLSACGQNRDLQQDQFQNTTEDTQQSAEPSEFSFEGTTFCYGENSYDLSSRVKAINCILSARQNNDDPAFIGAMQTKRHKKAGYKKCCYEWGHNRTITGGFSSSELLSMWSFC